MKKKVIGLTAITLALCLSAFTLQKKEAVAQYYWFPLDPSTGWPMSTMHLVFQSSDPAFCGNFGLEPYCNGAFTGYTTSGPYYYSAGFEVIVDHQFPFLPFGAQ